MQPQNKIDNISCYGYFGRAGISALFGGKTAAIKFMAADQIDGQYDNESQKQTVDGDGG